MFDYQGGRKKPTEPGNDAGLYGRNPLKAARVSRVPKDTKNETIGRCIGSFALWYAYGIHICGYGIVILGTWLGMDSLYLSIWGWSFVMGIWLLPVCRVLANSFTRDEEELGYKAIKVYVFGFLGWVLLAILTQILMGIMS